MGLFKNLFGEGSKERNVEFYANQLSKQMSTIAKIGVKIETYFPKAYQNCSNREFIEDSLNAFRSVGGQPGDAALEIYRDIDNNTETMRSFIEGWRESANVDQKTLSLANELYGQLEKLHKLMADTPQQMLAECKKIVVQKRTGAF